MEEKRCFPTAPHSIEAVRKMKESQLLREKMEGNVNERDKVRRREDTRKPQPNLETVVHSRSPGRHKCREHSSTQEPTKLRIGQLSRNVTKEHIFEIFTAFGNVKRVEFPMDKLHPGCGTGSAYVEYATPAEAQRAMKHMVGGQIDGQEITAALVLMPPKPRPPLPRPSPPRRPVHSDTKKNEEEMLDSEKEIKQVLSVKSTWYEEDWKWPFKLHFGEIIQKPSIKILF
ncbi:RNA-binding protein with serine-rich domain 1-like [Schistocerca nitens]|uniref:RNA-binding protein with serine-rich domain 1-like n=1 Tax=Schistocerca nitens TaxID=7011 RepID=UPI0021193F79|nr:RNA-binding protein with serine-rich domain 1-like [Schistocerca nitens]